MRIVIVGAGALGSIVAAMAARAGASVAVVARGKRADLIEQQGITLTGLADFTQRVNVIRAGDGVIDADVLVLCTKTFDTHAALGGLQFRAAPVALSLQNGVLKNEVLSGYYSAAQVLGAAATISGEILADGRVRFTVNDSLLIGEPDGSLSARAQAVAEVFSGAGLAARAVQDIRSVEWTKYAGFLPMMALALLTRLPTGRAGSHPLSAGVAAKLMREVAALATASGVRLGDGGALPIASVAAATPADAAAAVLKFCDGMRARAPEHRVSALQDLLRGGRLEVEDILGHAVELGRRFDTPLPTIETCYGLCAALADA